MDKHGATRGFYLIGLLLAVVIIMILTLGYFEQNTQGVSSYTASTGAAHRAECLANQRVFMTEAARWSIMHPGEEFTLDTLANSIPPLAPKPCRDGGTLSIVDGQMYCSIHNPAPMPSPTPTPRPAIDFLSADVPLEP